MAKTNEENGTDPYDMIATIKQLGLQGEMKENMTTYDLQSYLERGYPVILLLQAWKDEDDPTPYPDDDEDGHYVVAIGYDADYFYFEDPWIIGNLAYMKKSELSGRWHGDTLYPKERKIYGCGIIALQNSKKIPPIVYME